ncbi:MAG: DUF429 domain-containing protein [Haloarculaceae archaeon]
MTAGVLGADFSGAADAGRAVWVTEASHTPDGLVVEDCYRAADRWGSGRESAHAGLRSRVTDFAVAGLDFPFSLPRPVLADRCGGTWLGLVEWVTGDGPEDPDAFASACRSTAREHTGDGSAALRRETDLRRAALCPYGRRVQYQTFYGVHNVLAGLSEHDGAAVRPMQSAAGVTRVVEVYPAATFGWLGLYREGYKGDRERRQTNLDGIETCSVDLGGFRETYAEHHDALDSLAAALSAGRVTGRDPPLHGPRDEGHIYV